MWPSAALKVKLKTVEPIRMNITKMDNLVLFSSACLSRSNDSVRRPAAISSAPSAPMAPPSVGVAMPRKIVPSTRKISTSGGISTKVTRSVRRDSSPSPSTLLAKARPSARNEPMVVDRMKISSLAAGISRPNQGFMMDSCT